MGTVDAQVRDKELPGEKEQDDAVLASPVPATSSNKLRKLFLALLLSFVLLAAGIGLALSLLNGKNYGIAGSDWDSLKGVGLVEGVPNGVAPLDGQIGSSCDVSCLALFAVKTDNEID